MVAAHTKYRQEIADEVSAPTPISRQRGRQRTIRTRSAYPRLRRAPRQRHGMRRANNSEFRGSPRRFLVCRK